MRSSLFFSAYLAAAMVCAPAVFAQGPTAAKVPMAKLCGMCHEPEPGVMMGFLENIAIKSKTIQMDFMTHKEVVKFTDKTRVKYVQDFKDIRNYKKKGFQINYTKQGGERVATEIIRFDIMRAISDDEKLNRAAFKMLQKDPKVKVYDVRPPMKYKMGHIPGAGMMPAPAFDKFIGKLPKDKSTPIVFYGVGGCLSPTASMKTKSLGYENVRIYTGGFPDWSKNEYGTVVPAWLKMAIGKDIPHVLIDLRSAATVKKGHIKGAVGIEYAKLAASKEKFPERKKAPIIFYGPNSKDAASQAVSWGYKAVRILPMDFKAWKKAGNPVATGAAKTTITYVPRPKPGTIAVAEFEKVAGKTPGSMQLVDVRNPDEFAKGAIAGAVNIPVDQLGKRQAELDPHKELILYCNTGIRAEMGHNVLKGKGRKARYLDGTMSVEEGELEVEEN
ncbi:MAG: rhodanese-like domain-containing protein [Thermodesulfobacteriota bacterium]